MQKIANQSAPEFAADVRSFVASRPEMQSFREARSRIDHGNAFLEFVSSATVLQFVLDRTVNSLHFALGHHDTIPAEWVCSLFSNHRVNPKRGADWTEYRDELARQMPHILAAFEDVNWRASLPERYQKADPWKRYAHMAALSPTEAEDDDAPIQSPRRRNRQLP